MQLTEEQRKRCEENRKKALEIRRRKNLEQLERAGATLCQETSQSSHIELGTSGKTEVGVSRPFPVFRLDGSKNSNSTTSSLRTSNYFKGEVTGSVGSSQQRSSVSTQKGLKISFSLISRNRFQVVAPFCQDLVDICRETPTRLFGQKVREKLGEIAEVIPLPEIILSVFAQGFSGKNPEARIPNIDLSCLDPVLTENLFPFQKDGIKFVISKGGRALIADDMGLGKTVQAIGAAVYYHDEWPLLIVCPSSVRYTWAENLIRWIPSCVKEEDIFIITSSKDKLPARDEMNAVIITSYDMLVSLQVELGSRKFKVIVLDESHYIKSHNAQRTKSARLVCKNCKRLLLLTGTPALSRPAELYEQICLIRRNLFKGFYPFAFRYCDGRIGRYGMEANGATFMEELRLLLQETIMIRRLKSEVLKELPSKCRETVILDKTSVKTNIKELQQAREEVEREDLTGMQKRGALLKFFAETAFAKLDAVCKYIIDTVESCPKLLIFAHHQPMLDGISLSLAKNKVKSVRIDGNTSSKDRTELVSKFQLDEDIKVALLSVTAANTGLTLTAANCVIFAELFWNPGTLVQAEDRIHRVGQEDSVTVKYLVATGTADDYLWPLVQKKLDVLNKVGLSKDNFRDSAAVVIKDTPGEISSARRITKEKSIIDFLVSMESENILADESELNDTDEFPAAKRTKLASK